MIALDVIEDAARLRAFQGEWAQFAQKIVAPTPFQTPEWLVTWWSHFGGGSLRVMVFRNSGQLAGVLPASCTNGTEGGNSRW